MKSSLTRLIDTNIILRFLRRDDPSLSGKARVLFVQAEGGAFLCYIDEATVAEVVWVATSVYKMNREDIVNGLEELLAKEWVVNLRKHTILRALTFYRMSMLNYIDCWLLAVSAEKHIPLETFDMKLGKLQKKWSPI